MTERNTKTRGNGDGTVYFDSGRKRWVAQVRVKVGDRYRSRKRTASSKSEAKAALQQLQADAGNTTPEAWQSVAAYLRHWLAVHVKPNRKPSTAYSYELAVQNWIVPQLGNLQLCELRTRHVDAALHAWRKAGAGDRTIQNAFKVLQIAVRQAVRWQLVATNPCEAVETPRAERKADCKPFTAAEASRILEHTADSEFAAAFVLAFHTGMRGCELWGLRWSDVDWKAEQLHVRQVLTEVKGELHVHTPKSRHSVRTVALTSVCLEALRDRQAWCMSHGLAGCEHVFTTSGGALMRRGSWRRWRWNPTLEALGLEHRGFHHARHTFATLSLAAGVPVADVAATLGHHSPSVTWAFYAHALPGREAAASEAVGNMLSSA